jgi:hypothetical protein
LIFQRSNAVIPKAFFAHEFNALIIVSELAEFRPLSSTKRKVLTEVLKSDQMQYFLWD